MFRGHEGEIAAIAVSPDGIHLAAASQQRIERADGFPTSIGEVKVWSLDAGKTSKALGVHHQPVRSVVFSPDGAYLASASQSFSSADPGRVMIHEQNGRRVRHVLSMQGFGARHLSFDADGHTLVAMGGPGRWPEEFQAWNPDTGGAVSGLPAKAFSPDGLLAASATTVWEVATGRALCQLKGHKLQDNNTGVAFSPDSTRVATANWGGYYIEVVDGKETHANRGRT
jgi:WD40 repeat protein